MERNTNVAEAIEEGGRAGGLGQTGYDSRLGARRVDQIDAQRVVQHVAIVVIDGDFVHALLEVGQDEAKGRPRNNFPIWQT